MPVDEHLARQRKSNRLMAAGLAGVAVLVLLGMIMSVAIEIEYHHRAPARNPPAAAGDVAP